MAPIFESSGQWASAVVPNFASASEQVVLPLVTLGAKEKPLGRVTTAAFSSEGEGTLGLSNWGTVRRNSAPEGESAAVVVGSIDWEGLKESWAQSVVAGQGALAWVSP